MDYLKIILCFIIALCILAIWFGLLSVISTILKKSKKPLLLHFTTILASIPIICVTCFMNGYDFMNIHSFVNIKLYLITLVTAGITALIISTKENRNYKYGRELLWWGIDGVFMEIPQRLMMQSFLYGIMKLLKVPRIDIYTIIVTSCIWCIGIAIQNKMMKQRFGREWFLETLSSFIFSMGIGYVYQESGLLVISMLGHFCERLFSNYLIKNKSYNKNTFDKQD
ncbi:hypothetical protein [Anaerosporobacter faecicola]|uniref:hypothetical protein n=1 Tax=Anaerosporobacter faecicola TaxID=2718714 RepID=UPI001EE635CB|nr:hypothetical protein [Anaerosporobacter faecicola]